jgi:CRISPR-associated protein Cas4
MDWQGYWSVSDILNHVYCGRITSWWHVMGVPQRGTVKTEEGQRVHEEWSRREAQRRYEGKDLRVRRKLVGLRLSSERLGLAGTLDALVIDEDRMLPWDIKNTVEPDRPWPGQIVQMGAYSLLLEHALQAPPVPFGVVHYVRSGTSASIPVTDDLRQQVHDLLADMNTLRATEHMPDRAPPAKCRDCVYAQLCI